MTASERPGGDDIRMRHERRHEPRSFSTGGPVARLGPLVLTTGCTVLPRRKALRIDVKLAELHQGDVARLLARGGTR